MSSADSTWTITEVLPSQLGAGDSLLDSLLTQLEAFCWEQRDAFGIRLAVEEALVNAIRHGNCLDCGKRVHVKCQLTAEEFWIRIEDEGDGFDPNGLPDPTAPENLEVPSGRGVMLMRNFMSLVEYNEQGNCVEMGKRRSDLASAE
ncbi:MAG: ATP-binding protein [Planctomycetales bacterium]|nr:ATP-binding protein [Planctomycetales bacterium]